MLTREGFVAANMSAPTVLQRSSWKAEAIRKGNLKISGPIPIMEDTLLNEEEEKEFAETGALQSPSQPEPQDEPEQLDARPHTPPQTELLVPSIPLAQRASLTSHPVEDQDVLPERQITRSPPRPRQVIEIARESVVESTSPSQNGFRATPESTSKVSQKQKKRKSGLRNVFRKMFGRKDKDEIEEEPVQRGHNYHRSDPGMLQQSPPRERKTPSGPRISDLPVEDLQPLHPLGNSLPFPMNVNAPQASPPNEYLTFDMQRRDFGHRRATLPNIPSADAQRHSMDEPRGRLSVWEERPDEDTLPSPGIGIALSSPTHVTSLSSKRRSRSADALRDLVKERTSIDRRRSAEIRYWRQSHASASIYSRPQTAKTVETIRSVQMQGPAIVEAEDGIVEMVATMSHVDEPTPSPHEAQEIEPPVSAFNFGLKSGFSDDDTVPSEPPVPVSPPERNRNRLSIEDRVAHLEGTFQSIESSLRRMSSRNSRQTVILSDAPRNLRSRNQPNPSSGTNFDNLPTYQSSNDTLKSNPASPTLVRPSEDGSKENVIEKLYEALKYERSARKALEQQFQGLQHDIADLHALVNKLIASATATSPSYPTPSPDTFIISNEERLLTPRADDHSDYSRGKENRFGRANSNEKFARDDDEWRGDAATTPGSMEVWATPKEETFGGSGFFHERRGYV